MIVISMPDTVTSHMLLCVLMELSHGLRVREDDASMYRTNKLAVTAVSSKMDQLIEMAREQREDSARPTAASTDTDVVATVTN